MQRMTDREWAFLTFGLCALSVAGGYLWGSRTKSVTEEPEEPDGDPVECDCPRCRTKRMLSDLGEIPPDGEHYAVVAPDDPRREEWLEVFGQDYLPVAAKSGRFAKIGESPPQPIVLVDLDRIKPGQLDYAAGQLAERAANAGDPIDQAEIRSRILREGLPIRVVNVIMSADPEAANMEWARIRAMNDAMGS